MVWFFNLFASQPNSEVLVGFRWPLLSGLIALIVSWVLTPFVRKFAISKGAVDDPKRDDRRVHTEPLPRWGGLAIYAGLTAAVLVVMPFAIPRHPYPLWLCGLLGIGLLLVLVGALDDLYQYAAKIQLFLLLIAGVAVQNLHGSDLQVQIKSFGVPFAASPQWITLGIWAIPITAVYIFVITKTMDTIDGIDGLAAGIATIAAATLTIIAVYKGQPQVALVSAAVGGAALGFLKHNYNPAKIIMGTGGAYVLGFTLACLSIVGAFKTAATVALVIPVLVFGVPILDAFFVIVRRILSRVPITQGDKRHLHHTLLRKGLSQRQTAWVLYTVAGILAAIALALVKFRPF